MPPTVATSPRVTRGSRRAGQEKAPNRKLAPPRTALPTRPTLAGEQDRAAILKQLREHGPLTPAQLAAAVQIARKSVGYRIKPLIASGQVLVTGSTSNRTYTLAARAKAPKPEDEYEVQWNGTKARQG